MYNRCQTCRAAFIPPRVECSGCLESDMAWREVTGSGKLVSFSQLKTTPVGFDEDLSYSIAIPD